MRVHARVWVLSLICGVLLCAVLAPSALAAEEFPLVEKLVATNCTVSTCGEENIVGPFFEPKASITVKEAEEEGETEAGGRVPWGVTDFKVLTLPEVENEKKEKVKASYLTGTVEPTSVVRHIRTDVAPGLATDPFAVPRCTVKAFGTEPAAIKGFGLGFYTAPSPAKASEGGCKESVIGEQQATVFGGFKNGPGFEKAEGAGDLPLSGNVYDLIPGEEEKLLNGNKPASNYGVALGLPKALTEAILGKIFKGSEPAVEKEQYFAHSLILGSVEWGKETRGKAMGDFHDYFEIDVSTALPLVRSRLAFHAGNGFLTNATSCPGHLTTTLKVEDASGKEAPPKEFTTPIGLEGCNELEFEPKFALTTASLKPDAPTQFTAEASEEHEPTETDVSQVKSASFTLPEGMTLNPSAAAGLEACTTAQAHQEGTVFGEPFGVACPIGSKIGTVSLNAPTIPNGSLTGSVYLASGSAAGTITAPPYDIYVVANSVQYGISVRLLGETVPNPVTGQVTTYFSNPPEQPFTSLAINFERGVLSPIANPLICGNHEGSASFEPTSAPGTVKKLAFGVNLTECTAGTPPFVLTQGTESENETAGAHTSYSFSLARSDGQQYLKKIKTNLPLGLIGEIPDVEPLCAEAQANAGTCPASSKIGSVSVQAGAGSSPYTFNGTAYVTGPYHGAPYGMSIVVPANAGPFRLGNVVTRATININQSTSQVTAESELPTIYAGIPLRMRSINVNVNRQGFLDNPTNCKTPLATLSTLTSAEGAVQEGLSSPFTVTGCEKLGFAPKFTAATYANSSRSNGVSFNTTLTQVAGESNIKSFKLQLPRSLPSRNSTLKQACLAATFEANPESCPSGANVGTATAVTPTLPGKMEGKAYFVSHGGAAFPDLDLVLKNGLVKIILVGNTDITNGITTTTFATTPDVPVTSVSVNLPAKSNSALEGYGDLCRNPLTAPTTITGQNGKVTKQNTVITVNGCGVKVVGKKVIGTTAYLTIQTFAAGRISGSGNGVTTVARKLGAASRSAQLKVPLSRSGRSKHKPFKVKIRVGFYPKGKESHSTAYATVTFR